MTLDDMDMVDDEGLCAVCQRTLGDGEHECPAPGSPGCLADKKIGDDILYGPIEIAQGVLESDIPHGPNDDVPYGPEGDVQF